jgi:sugar phosphate isomerase/epimerase
MRALSLAALTVLGLSPEQQIVCAHKAGYQYIGLRLIPATPHEYRSLLLEDKAQQSRVRNLLSTTGIKILDIEVFRLEPSTNLSEFIPYIELGLALGAKNMLVAGYDSDFYRMRDNWLELCSIAKIYGIKPHLEPMPWTCVRSYLEAVKLVELAPPSQSAVLIDPIHFFRSGGNVSQITATHTSHMEYIQLCDAPMEIPSSMEEILRQGREDRLPLGLGNLPISHLLSKIPTHLPISLEVPLSERWGFNSHEEKAKWVIDKANDFLSIENNSKK